MTDKQTENIVRGTIIGCVVAIVLFCIVYGCIVGFPSSNSSSNSTLTCGYCNRTYPAGDSGGNYMCIARTHLCNNCYSIYKSGTEALDNSKNNK